MSDDISDDTGRATAGRLVASQMKLARQDEVIAIYEDLLVTIWNRLVPTLGRVSVTAILERSIADTAGKYEFIGAVKVGRDGLTVADLRGRLDQTDQSTLRDAFKELIANLIDLLAVLTGDIIVRQLLKDVEGGR